MKHFLVELLVALVLWAFESNLLVAEEHEVLDEDLGGLLKGVLRVNGTVRSYFKNEFVVVGLHLNAIRLN